MNTQLVLASLVAVHSSFLPIEPNSITPKHLTIKPNISTINQRNDKSIFRVKEFVFQGNTVLSSEELQKVVAQFVGKELSFNDLLDAANTVTDYYVEKGYINSGAYLPVVQNQSVDPNSAVVTIAILEGRIEKVDIIGAGSLENYIRTRVPPENSVLNNNSLLAALQLLRLDPLVSKIRATLTKGLSADKAILIINVQPSQDFKANVTLNNYRSPAIGSFERRLQLSANNLLVSGDGLKVGYRNTDGSNAVTANYLIPVNSQNGTIAFNYLFSRSNIIEQPFTPLDIVGDARVYEISFRQPLIRQATETSIQEFALGLTASRIESETSLQNNPFPVGEGADTSGRTRISALRFSQDWSSRNTNQALFLSSKFSWGLDIFGATINTNSPDGRFFTWVGQADWLRHWGETTLVVRTKVQLADRPLPILEQISTGGIGSVRGYRQDRFISDNAFSFSTELAIPVWKSQSQQLQVIPFFDIGTAWNNSEELSDTSGTLTSVGLGLQYRGDRFNARLDWGIPLSDTTNNSNTWQENGIYFSLDYQLF
ncbi:ShlB/FhaC/HecB family hemolysin secretion/activation protein [Anabaena azotica]|uniref:ShlB/FhaC/HecB family hemolysin secretion/activation protein n=1 Tax=Anabaena azotica FACHB-119 TaxID=947527 RepID=A0ABR8DES3_9NOST|nr:ShlB/FhaC/HecB family hemolysin secretion/activation protein [Anabaena azotica]MBD2505018.1 ShlB/FhaC/HecB family hemolysin secretion/activation protein [Anabaena azotica FACHB-119]